MRTFPASFPHTVWFFSDYFWVLILSSLFFAFWVCFFVVVFFLFLIKSLIFGVCGVFGFTNLYRLQNKDVSVSIYVVKHDVKCEGQVRKSLKIAIPKNCPKLSSIPVYSTWASGLALGDPQKEPRFRDLKFSWDSMARILFMSHTKNPFNVLTQKRLIVKDTYLKFNSEFSPEKLPKPKKKGSSSNHHFSGASC